MQSSRVRAIVVIFILCIGVFFALGKIRYAINPLMRQLRLQQYLTMVKHDNAIDPEKFWEFRDFYAATTSTFHVDNVGKRDAFLTFNTTYLESQDYLIPQPMQLSNVKRVCLASALNCRHETVFRSDSASVVIDETNKKLYIEFIKSIPEMQKANGFLRYFGVDLEPYKGYVWQDETVINL